MQFKKNLTIFETLITVCDDFKNLLALILDGTAIEIEFEILMVGE